MGRGGETRGLRVLSSLVQRIGDSFERSSLTWVQWIWIAVYGICAAFYIIWFSILLVWANDWEDHDNFVSNLFGLTKVLPLMEILLTIICVGVAYYVAVLCWQLLNYRKEGSLGKVNLHLAHKILIPVLIIVPVGLYWFGAYNILWARQFTLVDRSLQTTLPFIQLIVVVLLAPAVVAVVAVAKRMPLLPRIFFLLLIISIYLFFYSLPYWHDNCLILDHPLPPKPKLIAHRGFVDQFPENTMLAFNGVIDSSAVVIESDAGITMDGVIFHMHDEHFWRTTDVEEVFPERKKERIETFTAEEVKRLDAGKKQHGGKYAGEKVPFLNETLTLMQGRGRNHKLMFDLRLPQKETHPYFNTSENITLDMFESFNVSQNIIWITDDERDLHSRFPDMWLAHPGTTVNSTAMANFTLRNLASVNSNAAIRSSWRFGRSDNASVPYAVIAFTVSTPWIFDQMWCLGVSYVTTNTVTKFTEQQEPTFYMTRSAYYTLTVIWEILFGLMTLILAALSNRVARRRRSGEDAEEMEEGDGGEGGSNYHMVNLDSSRSTSNPQ